jgi:hypothetical protein
MSSQSTGGSSDSEAVTRLTRALGRLDAHSYFRVPADPSSVADTIVTGTTGVFLIAAYARSGVLTVDGGRPRVDGRKVPGMRALRRDAKKLSARLSAATVFSSVEPVICITHATVGAPRTVGGVRIVGVSELARDMAARPRVQEAMRAQRAARALGMQIAGDRRRHFVA